MTQFQYFFPCRGGIDSHEHSVYCGCEIQGLGTEVFPKSWKTLDDNRILDLGLNLILTKIACEVLNEEAEHVGDCVYCHSPLVKMHSQYKTIQGEIKTFSPSYVECNYCGGV